MKPMHSLAAVLVAAWLAAGCGLFGGGEEEIEAPAPLPEVEGSVALTRAWSADTGAGREELKLGLVATIDGDRVFGADHEGRVTALSLDDGRRLWQVDTELPVSGGPGAGDGVVVVGTSNAWLVALAAEDGRELWRARVSSEVLAPPQVGAGIAAVITVDGRVAAHDIDSGQRIWLYDSPVPVLSLRGTSPPLIDGDTVIVGLANGKLVALAAADGRLVWEASIALPRGRSELDRMVDIDGAPVLMGGSVYASTYQGRIAGVSRETGTLLWSREMSSHRGLGAANGKVFVGDAEGTLWALDGTNGAAYWSQEGLRRRVTTAPLAIGDLVAVGDFEGYLHILDAADGHPMARYRVGDRAIADPLRARGNTVYTFDDEGTLTAVTLGGGG